MKILKTLLFSFIAFSFFSVNAQDKDESTSYLFSKDGRTTVGGFGGPMVYFGEFNGDFAVMTGGGGAVILNRSFYMGGYGIGLATQHRLTNSIPSTSTNGTYDISYGHGGIWTGFVLNPSRVAHFTGSLKLGGGYMYYDQIEEDAIEYDIDGHAFFVMTPEVGVEINLFPYMKIMGSIGYQYVPGNGEAPVTNDKISSFMGGVTFKFGWFGDK